VLSTQVRTLLGSWLVLALFGAVLLIIAMLEYASVRRQRREEGEAPVSR